MWVSISRRVSQRVRRVGVFCDIISCLVGCLIWLIWLIWWFGCFEWLIDLVDFIWCEWFFFFSVNESNVDLLDERSSERVRKSGGMGVWSGRWRGFCLPKFGLCACEKTDPLMTILWSLPALWFFWLTVIDLINQIHQINPIIFHLEWTCFDVFWCVLMCFAVFWCVLMCFDVLWCVLMCFDVFCCVLMCFDLDVFWCVLTCFDVFWCVLMCFDVFWCVLLCFDVWCVLMCFDVFWCVLMCFDVLWCVLMCFELRRPIISTRSLRILIEHFFLGERKHLRKGEELFPPKVLCGRYEFVRTLGSGAYGCVCEAIQIKTGVSLKCVREPVYDVWGLWMMTVNGMQGSNYPLHRLTRSGDK